MRKTLLIAAAALAGSVISSQAQVYSQNIVGYVNVPVHSGFTAMSNPLLNGGGNSATNLFDTTSGANDGSILLSWTGTSYNQVMFYSQVNGGPASGFVDAATGTIPEPAPVFNQGQGFIYNNQNASNTVTFVGTVYTDGAGGSTNVVGVTTNILSGTQTYVLVGSKLPVGGGVSSALGLVNDGTLDGSIVLVPNILANGQWVGYTQTMFYAQKDGGPATGFTDAATGTLTEPEPVIPVGGCFLFSNQTGSDYAWTQSL